MLPNLGRNGRSGLGLKGAEAHFKEVGFCSTHAKQMGR